MLDVTQETSLTAVIKVTKFCNLRCRYCYEFAHLSNPTIMDTDQLRRTLRILSDIEKIQGSRVKICWHGGEPTLAGPEFFRAADNAIKKIFGSRRTQILQTNLFRLGSSEFEIFDLMDYISISYDVFGDDRVNCAGRDSGPQVIKNMDAIRRKGIKFGAINVLTKKNIEKLDQIFLFYKHANISARILPFYRKSNASQVDEFGLTGPEVARAFRRLVDLHLQFGMDYNIAPVGEFLSVAAKMCLGENLNRKYDKRSAERVIVIDTNGDFYGDGTAYQRHYGYGNANTSTAKDILESEGRQRAVALSESLQARACTNCSFWGNCSGIEVGEQTEIEIGSEPCPIWRHGIERALEWLSKVDMTSSVHALSRAAEVTIYDEV